MILYYITDRLQFPGSAGEQRRQLLKTIGDAARTGVDFIQLREKDLTTRELEKLARDAVALVHESGVKPDGIRSQIENRKSKILVNSRIDVALAAGADGVHLTSTDIAASDARAIWVTADAAMQSRSHEFVVATSCHTVDEVRRAEAHGSDFSVFAPVFEKILGPDSTGRLLGVGLSALAEACRAVAFPSNVEGVGTSRMPVLALGGVSLANAAECIRAGAAGVAGIRLFQQGDLIKTVAELRAIDRAMQGRTLC